MFPGQKLFYKAEDVAYAHSVMKVAYLKYVSVPKDEEPGF